ncbi:MAG TPA: hypothetical protein VFH46_07115 [Pyrinomonadaceae bacterium]|nr:hypothetical protein [Pyrinomonadaceae bacterium]
MNETNSPACERGSDLIAFLYNETDDHETRDFELHLQQCSTCREEIAAFGSVRESITAWRDEALSGFVATTPVRKKSALAALRQFFELSPLWLKGATAFALLAFCVLAALAIVRLKTTAPTLTAANPAAVYTEEDVNRRVKEALANQPKPNQAVETPAVVVASPKPKPQRITKPSQVAKSRRPLSKSEREQLAADLRLLHDADLDLLGDRINQY